MLCRLLEQKIPHSFYSAQFLFRTVFILHSLLFIFIAHKKLASAFSWQAKSQPP
jgi:hypothetical protein